MVRHVNRYRVYVRGGRMPKDQPSRRFDGKRYVRTNVNYASKREAKSDARDHRQERNQHARVVKVRQRRYG